MTTKDGLGIATQARVEVCTGGRAEGCTPAEVVERQAYVEEGSPGSAGEGSIPDAAQPHITATYRQGKCSWSTCGHTVTKPSTVP